MFHIRRNCFHMFLYLSCLMYLYILFVNIFLCVSMFSLLLYIYIYIILLLLLVLCIYIYIHYIFYIYIYMCYILLTECWLISNWLVDLKILLSIFCKTNERAADISPSRRKCQRKSGSKGTLLHNASRSHRQSPAKRCENHRRTGSVHIAQGLG